MKNPLCHVLGHDMEHAGIEKTGRGEVPVSECQRTLCDHQKREYVAKLAMEMMVTTAITVIRELEKAAGEEDERGESE